MEKEKVIQKLEKEVEKKVDLSQVKEKKEFTKVGKSKIKLTINRELTEEELEKVRQVLGI